MIGAEALEKAAWKDRKLFLKSKPASLVLKVLESVKGLSNILRDKEGALHFNSACIVYTLAPLWIDHVGAQGTL